MKIRTEFPHKVIERPNDWIKLSDGINLAARIWMPDDAETKPVPVVLEYLPYQKRGGTFVRDEITHPYLAGHGYACIRVDMRGNGESEGLMFDEYAAQELDDALEVIDWLCEQPWCDGNVGMMGISWGGFNSLQVAALQPKALKAVITLCSTVDRFNDDIHYKGGCLLNENLGWSATMLSFSATPPDPELVGNRWLEMWLNRLENLPHLAETWLAHQSRDDYWKHGSVCENYDDIKAAVLAVGGWGDSYKNAVPALMENLKAPCKGIIGPWVHKYPHFAVPKPTIGFLQEALRWWDYWLKGQETGIMAEPDYRAFSIDSEPPQCEYETRKGRWISEKHWPSENIKPEIHYLSGNALQLSPAENTVITHVSPQNLGKVSGEYCAIWSGAELPGDQKEDDNQSLCFDGIPFDQDYEILGAPLVRLKLSINQPQGNLYIRLCDVDDLGRSERVTYGVVNLTNYNGNGVPLDIASGELIDIEVKLDHCAHRFLKGQRIRLAISTTCWPLIWPATAPVEVSLHTSGCQLQLPFRSDVGQSTPVFAEAEGALSAELVEHRPNSNDRQHGYNGENNESTCNIVDDFGQYEEITHGLTMGSIARENYSIDPDNPLTAYAETHWTSTKGRGDWQTRTETFSSLRCDVENFYLDAEVEAYHGDDMIFEKIFTKIIPRNGI